MIISAMAESWDKITADKIINFLLFVLVIFDTQRVSLIIFFILFNIFNYKFEKIQLRTFLNMSYFLSNSNLMIISLNIIENNKQEIAYRPSLFKAIDTYLVKFM